jgi:adenylylsulfate kinase-like enzyme
MKKFIVINGAMGVGKTSICKELNKKLINSVWLDGDWCMMMNPLNLVETNKKMFLDNIIYLLNNYLSNPTFDYVLFSWVIPSEDIINYITKNLSRNSFEQKRITLLCEESRLKERMIRDGRDMFTIERSVIYQNGYKGFNTIKIDTAERSVSETVDEVLAIIKD